MNKEIIPKDWKRIKLKEVLTEVTERNKEEKVKKVLSVTNSQGFVNQDEYFEGTVHSADISNYKIVRKNQFAYNPSRVNVGSIDILEDYDEGALSPMYVVFEVDKDKLLPEYFKYYFKTQRFYENVKNNTQGSVRNSLSFKALTDFEYLLPPIKEQEKIVNILYNIDRILLVIDSNINSVILEKNNIIDETLNDNNCIEKTFNQLIDKKIIEDIMDGNHGELHPKSSDYVDRGIPFIMANNIHDGILDVLNCVYLKKEQTDKLRKGFAKKGDILLTHKGTIGNVGFVPYNIEYDYIMLTPQVTYYRVSSNNKVLHKSFVYYYLQSSEFQRKIKLLSMQSTRAYIGITEQKKLKIKIPKYEKQTQICKILNRIDHKIMLMHEKKQNYQKIEKGLIQQLLTGKVRVKI